jgi:hypothetical protein
MKKFRIMALAGLACSLAIAGLAVLAVLLSPFGDGAADGDGSAANAVEPADSDAANDPSSADEGIKVHGDWVIEVRNPDGSLAERREFENALTAMGEILLTTSLARQFYPGVWGVLVTGGPNPQPCGNAAPACLMREPITSNLDSWSATHFSTLTVAALQNPRRLELQGTFDAPQDGVINQVQTINCFGGPDPATCNNTQVITGTNITDVNVLEGQQVLVTVRISFS